MGVLLSPNRQDIGQLYSRFKKTRTLKAVTFDRYFSPTDHEHFFYRSPSDISMIHKKLIMIFAGKAI